MWRGVGEYGPKNTLALSPSRMKKVEAAAAAVAAETAWQRGLDGTFGPGSVHSIF